MIEWPNGNDRFEISIWSVTRVGIFPVSEAYFPVFTAFYREIPGNIFFHSLVYRDCPISNIITMVVCMVAPVCTIYVCVCVCVCSCVCLHVFERVYLGLPLDMYISYPTIEPHYHTPLYDRDLRDVAFYLHFTIRNKGLVSSQLLSAVWPGKQTVSRRSTSHVCLYTTPGRSYLYVRYKTALRLSIILETWFWLYVTYKTHLFASLDMPISKAL